MNQLQKIIDRVADLRRSTFFKEHKRLAVDTLGYQTCDWFIQRLVKSRGLTTPIKPSWLKAINKWVSLNTLKARQELEEARFEWTISNIISQKTHKQHDPYAPIAVLGNVFSTYLVTQYNMSHLDINIVMSHVLTKTEVTISDLLWAEHYYVKRATKQLSFIDNA